MPPGKVGSLPWPAWRAVGGLLSSPKVDPYRQTAWRATALELRRTCKALAELVGEFCVGGAGWLKVETASKAALLEAAPTAGFERALVVFVRHRAPLGEWEALARALAVAVERSHMVRFAAPENGWTPAAAPMIETALIEASHKGQLVHADLDKGESRGWGVDAMAQLSVINLVAPERETIATLVGAGALQSISIRYATWADMSILSSLRKVELHDCTVEDLSPLADVPELFVLSCSDIKALPAMRNDVIEVVWCTSLTDVSCLAGGRVGRLELWKLDGVEDVSAIGAMHPPPRTVVLGWMDEVQDVSMLAGVRRLEVIKCPKLDKAATLAALEGKVGTIRWVEK